MFATVSLRSLVSQRIKEKDADKLFAWTNQEITRLILPGKCDVLFFSTSSQRSLQSVSLGAT